MLNPFSALGNITNTLGLTKPTGEGFQFGSNPADAIARGKNSPYRSGWDALIKQLQDRASGPSLAEKQTRDVAAQGMNQEVAMSHGRSAGAAREAALGSSQITQGLEGKAVEARLAEQKQNDAMLANALQGASGNQYQYDALAQAQRQFDASRPTQMQQLAGIASQVGSAAAGAGAFSKGGAPTNGQPQAPLPGNPTTLMGAQFSEGQAPTTMSANAGDPFGDALDARYRSPQYLTGQVKSPYGPSY